MASAARARGRHPLIPRTWVCAVRVALLEMMFEEGERGVHKDDFFPNLEKYLRKHFLTALVRESRSREGHRGIPIDSLAIRSTLMSMLIENWIEPSQFNCSCSDHPDKDIYKKFDYSERFRLTETGYDKVPEPFLFP